MFVTLILQNDQALKCYCQHVSAFVIDQTSSSISIFSFLISRGKMDQPDSDILYEGWMVKSPPQKRSSHGYPLIKKVRNQQIIKYIYQEVKTTFTRIPILRQAYVMSGHVRWCFVNQIRIPRSALLSVNSGLSNKSAWQ